MTFIAFGADNRGTVRTVRILHVLYCRIFFILYRYAVTFVLDSTVISVVAVLCPFVLTDVGIFPSAVSVRTVCRSGGHGYTAGIADLSPVTTRVPYGIGK